MEPLTTNRSKLWSFVLRVVDMKSLIEKLKAHIAELSASRFFDKHLRRIGSGEKENTAHSHPILLCYLAPKSSNVHLKEYNFQEKSKEGQIGLPLYKRNDAQKNLSSQINLRNSTTGCDGLANAANRSQKARWTRSLL
jgi:hypothetical protein